jgi:hypothetical protein
MLDGYAKPNRNQYGAVVTNEDFFQIFGHISVFFATWDFFVTAIITRLVRPQLIKLRRLEGSTLGQKLHYLQGISEEETVSPDVCRRLQAALPTALEIAELRNRFIHDLWKLAPEDVDHGAIERLTLKLGQEECGVTFAFATERYSLEQLYEFLNQIGEQQRVFSGFLTELPGPA